MDKKAQLELDMETVAAGGMGLLCGGLAVFVMKGAGLGIVWTVLTFICSSIAGFFVANIIFNK